MSPIDVIQYIWSHPANRHRRMGALRDAIGWQLHKRFARSYREIVVFGDLRLRCYPDSYGAGVMIYSGGWPDYDDMHFMQRYLRPGDAFVDIGANIGIYTLLAASLVGRHGRVLAFEPGRRAFDRLEENVRINELRQVEARFAAVSDQPGTVRFLQKHDLINRIALSAESDASVHHAEDVPCTTLDLALEGTRYAMGKIDIEGAELMAFQGGRQMLAQANPAVWLLELKDRLLQRFGSSTASLSRYLQEAGYDLGAYDASSGRLSFDDTSLSERGNALAVHRTALDEVRSRIAVGQAGNLQRKF